MEAQDLGEIKAIQDLGDVKEFLAQQAESQISLISMPLCLAIMPQQLQQVPIVVKTFSASQIEKSGIGPLDEGMRVSFDTEPDKRGKGPKAVNLQVAE